MIFVFDIKHPIRVVCDSACPYCNVNGMEQAPVMMVANKEVPNQPLYILREATIEEYRQQVRDYGFSDVDKGLRGPRQLFFYDCSAD